MGTHLRRLLAGFCAGAWTTAAWGQGFPPELVGQYTFRDKEACGAFKIERNRVFGEDMGCELLHAKQLHGEPGQDVTFSVTLSCQMDDSVKPKLRAIFTLEPYSASEYSGWRYKWSPSGRGSLAILKFRSLESARGTREFVDCRQTRARFT
jgi:hypothetical protein